MIKNNIHLFQKITEKVVGSEISLSGNGYEYPPMFIWYKIPSTVIKNNWERFLQKKEYFYPGIYVHIPFCITKCIFCQFFSVPARSNLEIDRYLDYLEKEAKIYNKILKKMQWRTLYIGGGTPSLLNLKQLDRLFHKILYKYFDFSNCIQVAFEANPSTLNYKKLFLLKKYNVNRLTIGVQTLDEKIIKLYNRTQKIKDVYKAYNNTRRVGIDYINIDLMIGLPGQTTESFINTYKQVLRLKPDVIHLNPFHPTPTTLFSKAGNFLSPQDVNRRNQMIRLANEMQFRAGYKDREYELPESTFEGRNIQLVDQIQYNSAYLGLGASASSHINDYLRYLNYRKLDKYYTALEKGELPIFQGYRIKNIHEMVYYVTANLRHRGVSKSLFLKLFNKNIEDIFPNQIKYLEKKKKIKNTPHYIISTMKNINDYLIYSKVFYGQEVIKKCETKLNYPYAASPIKHKLIL